MNQDEIYVDQAWQKMQLAEELTVNWNNWFRSDKFETRQDPHLVTVMSSLASHTFKVAEAAIGLWGNGLVLESIPLIRASYEAGLRTAWVLNISDAPYAMLNEHVRNKKAYLNTLKKADLTPIPYPDQIGAFHLDEKFQVSEGTSEATKHFQAMCQDMEPQEKLYAVYRAMSSLCHPSSMLVESYVGSIETARVAFFDVGKVMAPDQLAYAQALCSGLIWAGRSITLVDSSRHMSSHRTVLRKFAQKVGIPAELNTTDKAKARSKKAFTDYEKTWSITASRMSQVI